MESEEVEVPHPSLPAARIPEPAAARASRGRWLAAAGVVLVLLPFAGKAFTIDDPLFLWLARHLLEDPWDFYGFEVNWYGTPASMAEITKNPPLSAYYLALLGRLFGWGEWALHLGYLVPAALCALGTHALARRLTGHPLAATWIGLSSPIFLVSSTNVMCDTTMLALWCGSLVYWLRGHDEGRLRWLWLAALLAGLAGLTKYFGISLLPLLLLHGALRRRAQGRPVPGLWLAPLALPLALWTGYQLWTDALYGRGLLLDAAEYASDLQWSGGGSGLGDRTVVGLAFAGGLALPALFLAPLLWSRRVLLSALALAAVAAALLAGRIDWTSLAPTVPTDLPWTTGAQLVLLVLTGAGFVGLAVADVARRPRDPEAWLLCAWALGTLVFAAYVNWVNNGRSNLPLAPVLGLLVARRLAMRGAPGAPLGRGWRVGLGASLAVSLLVTAADARWAGGVRTAAHELTARYGQGARQLVFTGHWGFQWYMQEAGARPMDLNDEELRPGDVVVQPTNNTHVYPFHAGLEDAVELLEAYRQPARAGFHTVSTASGAGFYSAIAGPLPFVVAPGTDENTYFVSRIRRSLRYENALEKAGLDF